MSYGKIVQVSGHIRDGYWVKPHERGAGPSRNEYQHEGAKKPLPEYRRNASDEENRKFYDLAEKTMLYGINTNLGMQIPQNVIDSLLDHGILKELPPIEHEGRTAYAYEDVQGNIAIGYDDGDAMKRLTLFERTEEKQTLDETVNAVSERGVQFIAASEGSVVNADGLHVGYYCDAGKPTIGYGHAMTEEEKKLYKNGITEEQAIALLRQDVKNAELGFNKDITAKLSQNQRDALTSFFFNLGPEVLKETKTLDLINNTQRENVKYGTFEQEYGEFRSIKDKDGKLVRNNGLIHRRNKELDLYNNGEYGNATPANMYDHMKKKNRLIYP